MSVRKIIRMGHPTLRQRAQELPAKDIGGPGLHQLLEDMADTLADSGGIGLAAPQIDVPLRVAIIDMPQGSTRYDSDERIPHTVFINPVITVLDDEEAGYWEGCLSVPGLRGFVQRPQHVRVDYLDQAGVPRQRALSGFSATVIQHECDHLDGRLYIDHIKTPELLMFEEEWLEYHAAR